MVGTEGRARQRWDKEGRSVRRVGTNEDRTGIGVGGGGGGGTGRTKK